MDTRAQGPILPLKITSPAAYREEQLLYARSCRLQKLLDQIFPPSTFIHEIGNWQKLLARA
jgi:hypothetical protein